MCLKPTLLLWLAAVFLSRAVMLPILIGVGHVAGVNADAMTLLRDYWSEDQLIPAVAAFPVLCTFCRRVPTASTLVRRIWAHGRLLLSLAAALDLALPLAVALWRREVPGQSGTLLLTGAIDVYFLAYLLAARRVRDTFLDFPPVLAVEKKTPARR
jgi:hypothetical protein